MANHRPKSLSELNQVYDKAMQAQRAIKEGSQSLSSDDDAPKAEAPSQQNIFEELRQQAGTAKKAEIYDSEIADIANDFLKRYAKPEQRKPQAAPKELKRPAPSIQSLYHTPVKQPHEQPANDVSIAQSEALPIAPAAPVSAVRPKPFESIEAPSAEIIPQAENEAAPAPLYRVIEDTAPQQTVQFSVPEDYAVKNPTPQNRMTSAERNDLINEYKRVMSDDDDTWSDDDEEYARPKKSGFWSRLTKRRQEPTEEIIQEAPEALTEEAPSEEEDEALDMTDIYSGISQDPAEAESEEVPMSLYDYIEADFDYGDEAEIAEEIAEDIPEETAEEETEVIPEAVEVAPEAEEFAEEAEAVSEAEEIIPEEIIPEEIIPEEIIPEETAEEEETAEDFPKEAEEDDSYIEEVIPEETVEAYTEEDSEEVVIYPEEEASQEAPLEELPTAGMVFDDIFSVSDESKRSYTGGDWSHSNDETASEDVPNFEEAPEEEEAPAVKVKKVRAPRRKVSPALKVVLSLVMVILIALAGAVTALGTAIGVDTGKIFGDSYRAFSAQQNFSLSGIYAGDLIITQDYNTYEADGDSFVYVNYDTKEFMVGKYKGHTYGLTGDLLYVAENEAGKILVLREDTLGAVVKTYSGLGTILSVLSNNFIIIDAVILVLFVAVLLVLILAGRGKKQTLSADAENSQPAAYEEEYTEDTEEDDPAEEYDTEDFDPDEYDTDDIEEGLFSGI